MGTQELDVIEQIDVERKQVPVDILIFLATNYGESHYIPIERASAFRIQPVTTIKVKTNEHELQPTTIDVAKSQDINEVKLANTTTPWDSQEMQYDESTVEMGIVKPKSVGMTIQEIKPSRNMKLSELQIYDPEDVDEESEPICNEVMKPLQQIPLDNNCLLLDMQEPTMNETITYYDAVMEPTHYYLENMDQNNENYSDPLSHEDKNVLPMDSEYYLGVKKKTQQRIGRQVSFNLLTSQVLGYNEPCQWKQRNSTHMGPVHCVNRKRKKKRTSQGLSRIELQHVKMNNLQTSFNLMRMLIKYII